MRHKFLLTLIISLLLFSCKKEKGSATAPSPATPVLLKDIVIPHLPSPFYHFEYNPAGKVAFASFASGLTMYDVAYQGDRISEMRNNIIVNKDRLQYHYDNAGRVDTIRYADSTGSVYTRIFLTYEGQKLVKLEREKKSGANFILDKVMTLLYYPDGNLLTLTEHRLPFNGQNESTVVDRYEEYDNKINVDGFSLLHNEFFDHLFLLPDIQLQKNNPGKVTHTGDGVNYIIGYTYTYNGSNIPLAKDGVGIWLNGNDIGQRFASNSAYSYY